MVTLKIRNIEIGNGIPKICAPLTGCTKADVFEEISLIDDKPVDIVEWRGDFFGTKMDIDEIINFLPQIKEKIKKKVLLFTFRSKKEGGLKEISEQEYLELNTKIIQSGIADIIDIELSAGEDTVKALVHTANINNCYVLMSSHDFDRTPGKEIIIKRCCTMHTLGADIAKIAVMPNSPSDVAIILLAMAELEECYADKPFIIVSMSGKGLISRISGEVFGSAVTFGSIKKPSAPGQIAVDDLKALLDMIHNNLQVKDENEGVI